jgi:ABC-type hemin transport system substrate-binding protein
MSWRPDVIVVGSSDGTAAVPAWLSEFPGVNRLPCVRDARVVRIRSPLLASTSHHLVEAAHELQQQLIAWRRP